MSMNEKKNTPKKKGFSVARLFQSNRFVLVFSLFTAIVLWFIMAINNTESRARVIDGVPIEVTLSEEAERQGYQVFEMSDTEARVSVTGNNITVNQLAADDMAVSAALASNITRTGTYTLNLSATQNSSLTDYTFDTVYPGSVIVFVDKAMEKTLKVETNIQYKAAEDYYASKPSLNVEELTITGPESEVSEVDRVVIETKLDTPLKESVNLDLEYIFYNKDGEKITDMQHMKTSGEKASVTIDVLKKADLPVKATFKNLPEGLDVSSIVTVSPKVLKVGYLENADTSVEEIILKAVDMSGIDPDNATISTSFEIPKNCTNISGEKNATIKFDLDGYEKKTYMVKNFFVMNAKEDTAVTVETTQLGVTLVGPKEQLEKLKASDIDIQVDMTDIDSESGSLQVPATVNLDAKYGAWAYGSYNVYVNIKASE